MSINSITEASRRLSPAQLQFPGLVAFQNLMSVGENTDKKIKELKK
jgi:hypothetical protein